MMETEKMKQFVLSKVLANAEKMGENTPIAIRDKKFTYASIGDWRLGFWGGLLNYCYMISEDEAFLKAYEKQREKLLHRLYEKKETLDHDIGFLYMPTEFARYRLFGDEDSRKAVITAADELVKRFNTKGNFIRAWDWDDGSEFAKHNPGRLIIDCMFNLPLLFEVSKLTGNQAYYEIAYKHAKTSAERIVRADGTTYHTYVMNPDTGEAIRGETWQGLSNESCWSRGQAWAVGGFTMAYRYTRDQSMLDTAIRTADKYISLLEENYLPVWDFDLKGQDVPYDSSAAAIACCGLLELSEYVSGEKKAFYKSCADKTFMSLWQQCATRDDDEFEALITHATGFFRMNSEIDTGIIYADYYFVKALVKYLGMEWIVST